MKEGEKSRDLEELELRVILEHETVCCADGLM